MMKGFLRSVLGLATLASAISSQYADDLRSRRAVSDQCTAPEGTGSCQHTSDCPGISYPTGLCPNDPTDVQCCVEIKCNVPKIGSGYCRSVKNNDCPGGDLHADFCPGDSDIKCCVKDTPETPPPASTPATPAPDPCSGAAFEKLVFRDSISAFVDAKSAERPSCFIWADDGCSCSPDDVGDYDFLPPCKRHDFGYRNAKEQGRFNPEMKERIDDKFKDDLYDVCAKFTDLQSYKGVQCRRIADIYVLFVRKFGKKKRDGGSASLQKRECDLKDALGL